MRAGGLAAAMFAVASVMGASGASLAGCPSQKTLACVDFSLGAQAAQQIVAVDKTQKTTKPVPAIDEKKPYTGPTVGLTPTVHKAPTLGYRWAID